MVELGSPMLSCHKTAPLLFPSSPSWVMGGSCWLGQPPKPREQQGPLPPSCLGVSCGTELPTHCS